MIYKDEDYIYDSDTGGLIHARDKNRNVKKYSPCGISVAGPYKMKIITVRGKNRKQCDVIWELIYGPIPMNKRIVYKNEKQGNRLSNLELVEVTNPRARVRAVTYSKSARAWMVKDVSNQKHKFVGMYIDKDVAVSVSNEVNKGVEGL